ncbi:MAG TPA: FAD binding domain-containing protein [Candidatus Limnocylindria bacterium]
MRAEPFDLIEPATYGELLAAARQHAEDGKLIAGGQSLLAMMNLRLVRPAVLVAVGALLDGEIHADAGDLVIPAGTRHAALIRDPLVRRHFPSLADAASHIGNIRVRNRGTIGGSLAHADATGELPCVLAALRGRIVVASLDGEREIAAEKFVISWFTSALEPGEIVREVRIPIRRSPQAFAEFARRTGDFALVEVAVAIERAQDGAGRTARVALGGVGERPEVFDRDVTATPDAVSEAAEAIAAAVDPPDDHRATSAFRRELAAVLVRGAIAKALAGST